MNLEKLNELSLSEICYILLNEKDSYSLEEINILENRKKELSKEFEQKELEEEIKNRPAEFKCPKCDGINKSSNIKCDFCGYEFKRDDYLEQQDDNNSSNMGLFIIALLLPIVGIILGIVYIAKDNDNLGKTLIIFSIVVVIIFSIIWLII